MLNEERSVALRCYAAATLAVILGVALAARQFPGGFDWVYTVISRLASPRHNPGGGMWVSGSLLVAVLLLWPVAGHLERRFARGRVRPRVSIGALRMGLIGGAILSVEGLLALDFSRLTRKTHEILALVTFLGFYWGVLGLHLHLARHTASSHWPALLVILPLLAVGLSQAALYFDQRDLGWVNTSWREIGVPFWLSFAFWQWLAVAFLGAGLGYLIAVGDSVGPGSDGAQEVSPPPRRRGSHGSFRHGSGDRMLRIRDGRPGSPRQPGGLEV